MGISVLFPIVALLAAAVGQVQAQTAVIAGRLTRDGKPAAGIRVSAMVVPDPGVPVSEATALASVVLTDRDGSYRLENVPPGHYYLTAGFLDVPTYYPGVLSIRDATAVKVDAGVTLSEINFSTAAPVGVAVSGTVLLPSGQTAAPNSRTDVAHANLLTAVPPLYPPQARAEAVTGTVTLRASIDKEGKLSHASVLVGHPMLHDAAIEAARQWRYRPQVVNGQPVAVVTTITMNFPPEGK